MSCHVMPCPVLVDVGARVLTFLLFSLCLRRPTVSPLAAATKYDDTHNHIKLSLKCAPLLCHNCIVLYVLLGSPGLGFDSFSLDVHVICCDMIQYMSDVIFYPTGLSAFYALVTSHFVSQNAYSRFSSPPFWEQYPTR